MSVVSLLLAAALLPSTMETAAGTRRVYVRVDVTEEGHIARAEFRNRMQETLEASLRQRMAQWRFEPAMKAGTPVVSATTLSIDLRLSADGERVDVVGVHSGPEPTKLVGPEYTTAQAAKGLRGGVVLRCRVTTKGLCADTTVESSSAPPVLAKNAVSALSRWRFIPDSVDGKPIESWVLMPFCFQASSAAAGCVEATKYAIDKATPALRLRTESLALD